MDGGPESWPKNGNINWRARRVLKSMTRGGVIESPHPTSFVNQVQKTKETGVYRGGDTEIGATVARVYRCQADTSRARGYVSGGTRRM